jgi:RNA polymerase sigma factor (sigma-70 family)
MGVGTALARPVAPPGGFLRALGDERLVARVRGGDDRAFEAIYDRHHRALLSFCRHMLGSREEAEDALQHTFAAAYRSLRSSDSVIQLKAWLYAIARNQCLSILRARREQLQLEDYSPATEGLAAEVERRGELRELLADLQRLPDDQRAALVLSELEAHSHEEIAVILGVRKDKVKALVFQARESLATSRQARDTSCREIQEQLSVLRGGALRRGPLRRHLQACTACQAFRAEVARQRAAMAVVLPVAPSLALKSAVLGPIFGGAAAGGAVVGAGAGAVGGLSGSAAGAGGGLSLAGKSLAAKALLASAIAGSVGGGTAVVEGLQHHHHHRTGPTRPVQHTVSPAPATPLVGAGAAATNAPPAPRAARSASPGHLDRHAAHRAGGHPAARRGAVHQVAAPPAPAPAAQVAPPPYVPVPPPAVAPQAPAHPFAGGGPGKHGDGHAPAEPGPGAKDHGKQADQAAKDQGKQAEQAQKDQRKQAEQAQKQQRKQADQAAKAQRKQAKQAQGGQQPVGAQPSQDQQPAAPEQAPYPSAPGPAVPQTGPPQGVKRQPADGGRSNAAGRGGRRGGRGRGA